MSVQLIAGSKIEKNWFYNTDVYDKGIDIAGISVGQPMPGAHNKGDMRIVASGGLNNAIKPFRYYGTVTTAGANTYSFTDSVLSWFEDGSITDFTVTFTSGLNDGEDGRVTQFTKASGLVSVSVAFTNTPQVGDQYTLELYLKDTFWAIECIESGGAGVGEFKIQYQDNNVFNGLDTIGVWSDETNFRTDGLATGAAQVVQAQNGNLIAFFTDSAQYAYYQMSYDRGLTWEEKTLIYGGVTFTALNAIVLASGRILVNIQYGVSYIYYSDDHGETWDGALTAHGCAIRDMVELPSGSLFCVFESANTIQCKVSNDGGLSWSDSLEIANTTNDQKEPTVVVAANGDLVVAYASNEDVVGYYEIKCKTSKDGGATWGSTFDIANDASTNNHYPWLEIAHDGKLWCAFVQDDDLVNSHYSKQHDGSEWWLTVNYHIIHESVSLDSLIEPRLSVVFGHQFICAYNNATDTDYHFKTMYEFNGWNGSHPFVFPLPSKTIEFYAGVNMRFFGTAVEGDRWEMVPQYQYAPSNIVDDNPNKKFRSIKDNAEIELLIAGSDVSRIFADAVAVFGCNMRNLEFNLNDSNWSGWSGGADMQIQLDLAFYSGSLGAGTDGNAIIDFDIDTDFKAHELVGKSILFTSGNESGNAYRILDNAGEWMFLDTNVALDVATFDTYRILSDRKAGTVDQALKHRQYAKLTLNANHTPEDYMEVGTMIAGHLITLDRAWMPGYTKALKSGIDIVRNKNNEIMPFVKSEDKRVFNVAWNANTEVLREILAIRKTLEGRNLCLIPDSTDLADIYLVKLIGDIDIINYHQDTFNFSLTFEEV